MEPRELELLEKLAPENDELQALKDAHLSYEKQIKTLEHKHILSPEEEMEIRELKKKKLEGKTRMVELIEQYSKKEG